MLIYSFLNHCYIYKESITLPIPVYLNVINSKSWYSTLGFTIDQNRYYYFHQLPSTVLIDIISVLNLTMIILNWTLILTLNEWIFNSTPVQ